MSRVSIISRREFIILSSLSIGFLIVPFSNCKTNKLSPLTKREIEILQSVLDVLFPDDGFGPSHNDCNSIQYIMNVLNDPFYDGNTKVFIIDGIEKINSLAGSIFMNDMSNLSFKQKQQVIERAIEKGVEFEQWISKIITLIIESLLADPIYGGNPNEIGWKWLNHYVGFPRPDEKTSYQNLYPWEK